MHTDVPQLDERPSPGPACQASPVGAQRDEWAANTLQQVLTLVQAVRRDLAAAVELLDGAPADRLARLLPRLDAQLRTQPAPQLGAQPRNHIGAVRA